MDIDQLTGLLTVPEGGESPIARTPPGQLLGERPLEKVAIGEGKLGLEPTIYLDEKKRYLDHLNELRRVNLGDDNADTAGYGLYLVRIPVSIQPGEKTYEGYGADASTSPSAPTSAPPSCPRPSATSSSPTWWTNSRPVVFEILERKLDEQYLAALTLLDLLEASGEFTPWRLRQIAAAIRKLDSNIDINYREVAEEAGLQNVTGQESLARYFDNLAVILGAQPPGRRSLRLDVATQTLAPQFQSLSAAVRSLVPEVAEVLSDTLSGNLSNVNFTSNRYDARPYPVAPSDMGDVFLVRNLLRLARAARAAQTTVRLRATDLRSFLSQELFDAYAIIARHPEYPLLVEDAANAVENHQFSLLGPMYHNIVATLPGDLQGNRNDPTSILSYAITVDAGLLNRRLREDMRQLVGQNNFAPACDVDALFFYVPTPLPERTRRSGPTSMPAGR